MGISRSECSKSITKNDLGSNYRQGFADGVKAVSEIILNTDISKVLKEEGYPCGDCNCEPVRIVLDRILSVLN